MCRGFASGAGDRRTRRPWPLHCGRSSGFQWRRVHVGLGRIVTLCYRSPTLYHFLFNVFSTYVSETTMRPNPKVHAAAADAVAEADIVCTRLGCCGGQGGHPAPLACGFRSLTRFPLESQSDRSHLPMRALAKRELSPQALAQDEPVNWTARTASDSKITV